MGTVAVQPAMVAQGTDAGAGPVAEPVTAGLPSRSYAAEPDPETPGHAIVVRVSSDPAENGTIVGRTTGPHAMTCAIAAAQIMSQTGRQPRRETAARLGYTPRDGYTF